jgi:hypothetical protein
MRSLMVPLALAALTISSPAFAGSSNASKASTKVAKTAKASANKSSSKSGMFAALKKAKAKKAVSNASVKTATKAAAPKSNAVVSSAAAKSAPASVIISTACQGSDISPGATSCAGFVSGNIINSGGGPGDPANPLSANEEQMAQLLAQLGFTYTGDSDGIEQAFANASGDVTFNTILSGSTIIGVHYGNGQNSPGGQGSGNDTAFYLFNADLLANNTFRLNFGSSSTVTLFQTSSNSVPEPGTWAMMLLGFGFVGAAVRRQRRAGKLPRLV